MRRGAAGTPGHLGLPEDASGASVTPLARAMLLWLFATSQAASARTCSKAMSLGRNSSQAARNASAFGLSHTAACKDVSVLEMMEWAPSTSPFSVPCSVSSAGRLTKAP